MLSASPYTLAWKRFTKADAAARSPSPIPSRRASSERPVEGRPRSRTPDSTSRHTVEFNSLPLFTPQGDPDIGFITMKYGWNNPTDSLGSFPSGSGRRRLQLDRRGVPATEAVHPGHPHGIPGVVTREDGRQRGRRGGRRPADRHDRVAGLDARRIGGAAGD